MCGIHEHLFIYRFDPWSLGCMRELDCRALRSLSFVLLLRLAFHVDSTLDKFCWPSPLQAFFAVDCWYLDSVLDIGSRCTDELSRFVVHSVLDSERWPLDFEALHHFAETLAAAWNSVWTDCLRRRVGLDILTAALLVFSARLSGRRLWATMLPADLTARSPATKRRRSSDSGGVSGP